MDPLELLYPKPLWTIVSSYLGSLELQLLHLDPILSKVITSPGRPAHNDRFPFQVGLMGDFQATQTMWPELTYLSRMALICGLAQGNHRDALMWCCARLKHHISEVCKMRLISSVLRSGDLELVFDVLQILGHRVVNMGNLFHDFSSQDVLEWDLEYTYTPLLTGEMENEAILGHIDHLKRFLTSEGNIPKEKAPTLALFAVRSGLLLFASQWMMEKGVTLNTRTLNEAAWCGKVAMVRWMVEDQKIQVTDETVLCALFSGDLALVKYLSMLARPPLRPESLDAELFLRVSRCRRYMPTDILEWLMSQGSETHPAVCREMAFHGRLEALVRMIRMGCRWDPTTCLQWAALAGQFHVLDWIHKAGYPLDKSNLMRIATWKNHRGLIWWVQQHVKPLPRLPSRLWSVLFPVTSVSIVTIAVAVAVWRSGTRSKS